MALGNASTGRVRVIVWRLDCQRQVKPDPAELAERYGAGITGPDGTLGSSAASAAAVGLTWW
jgi:hypothetical protein